MMSLIRPNIPGLNIPFTPPKPRPIKLLSIDGGGIQGMAALVTIRELMRRIQRELGLFVTPLPCEYFDLIAGTGIGGLIAIMLGKLRMSVDEAMDWFQEIVTHVFLRRKSWGDGSFKATTLELVVGRMVLQRAGRVDAQMVDDNVSDEGCRTVVCAKSAHTMGNVILFRSYKSFENRAPDCSIVQAVRATTARPGLFKPVDIEDHGIKLSFVDAVFGCNNPTALMLDEAKLIFPDQYVGCIISVGTGQTSTASIPPPRKIGWGPFTLGLGPSTKDEVQALERISTDSERTSQELQVRFQHTPDVYFRFNVEQGLQNTGVADLDKIPEVAAHAMSSNQLVDVNSKLKSAAQAAVSGGALIKTAQLDGSIARALPKSRVKACPPPSIVFTGQNHIILKIEECFLGDSQTRRHVFVLHGLGGSGKTQIALKFVEKHRDVFWDVFYIDASSAERISADLKSIALVKRAGETEDDALTWLAEKDEKWLIVFDNADNTSLDLRKYFPACAHGDILITTRNRQMINMVASESQLGNKDECQVSGMLLEDAKELLLKTSGAALDGTTEECCVALVEEFGHLALAIIQAGAYIRVNECTVQEYSEMYKRNKLVLEESRKIVPQIDNYAWTVYTTWRISYDQLKERVAEFLRMLGFMHHDGISETFFQNACERLFAYQPELLASPEDFSIKKAVAEFLKASFCGTDNEFDKPAFLDVIRELRSYSLVDFNPYDRTYSVHSLLHDWVRRLDAENAGTTRSGVGLLLALSVRYDAQSQICTSQQRQLLPHIDTLLADFDAMPCTANSFAWVYQQNQQWISAESLLTVALEASERILGKAHPTTLYNLENLAATVSYQERWSEVETLRLKAIDTCKQALGTDHAHTLWAMANLATHYSTQKQFQKAELLQSRIVDIKRRTFGPNHSDTLQSMSNLAITYVDLDQFQKAEDLQQLVLDNFKQCAGPQHPNTLTSMQALAWTWAKQKKWSKSHLLQMEVKMARSEVLGTWHRDTLESRAIWVWLMRSMPKRRPRRAQVTKTNSSTKEDSSSESAIYLPLTFQTKNKTPSVSSTLPRIRVNSPSESSICSPSDTESFKSFGSSEENILSNNRDELKNGSRAQSTTVSNNDVPQNAPARSSDLPMSELLAASHFSSPPAAEIPFPFSADFTNIVPISAIFPNYTISPHIAHSYSSSRSHSPVSHHSPSRLVRPKSSFTDRSIGKKKVLVEPVDDTKEDQSVGPFFYSNSDREGSMRSKKSRDMTVVSTSDEEPPFVRPKSPFTDLTEGNGKASDKPADSSTENQRDEPLLYSNSDGEAIYSQQPKREPMKSEKSMAVTVVSVSDEDD